MKTTGIGIGIAVLLLAFGCEQEPGPILQVPSPKPASIESLVPQAQAILKTSLEDSNSYIRTPAVEVAVETDQRQFLPRIMQLTEDPVVTVRFAAMVGLGDMKCTSCKPAMERKRNDPNPNVQIAAAYGLVKIGDGQYHADILQALKSTDPTVTANAVLLLGKIGNRNDLGRLYEIIQDENASDKVLFQTVESLARLGDPKVYKDKIWPLLISKYHDDRVWGIRCMGVLGTPEAQTAIQTMLQDDVLEVRLAAAEQLGSFKDRSGSGLVEEYFNQKPNLNETSLANQMAVAAIGKIPDPKLYFHLPGALASKSPIIRLIAAKAVLLQTK
jgi:HEAT repeat protein